MDGLAPHPRQFLVYSDNIVKDGIYPGIRTIYASSGPELLEKVCKAYELPWPVISTSGPYSVNLWSGQFGTTNRVYLNYLPSIPIEICDVWVRMGG